MPALDLARKDLKKCQCSPECEAKCKDKYATGHNPSAWSGKKAKLRRIRQHRRLKKQWKDPKYRKAIIANSRKNFFGSEVQKKRWADKEYYQRMCEVRKQQATPARNKANSERIKSLWRDPKYRRRKLKMLKETRKLRAQKCSKTLKQRYAANEIKVWCEGQTKETNKILARISTKSVGRIPQRNIEKIIYKHKGRRVRMRSWWEVAYAEYLDREGIKWEYEPRWFNIGSSTKYKGISYTPDFYLPETKKYVEIKGRFTGNDKAKIRKFKKLYPKIKLLILRGKQLHKLGILGRHGCAILSASSQRRKDKAKQELKRLTK